MKIGIVDVGGGYRGIYAAGVLDYCLDNGINFDLGIGVSAGSANLGSFVSGQPRRNYKFYTEYGHRKEYASTHNFVTKKSFIDMDYVYNTLSNSDGEYPIDYDYFLKNPMDYVVVATDAITGKPRYFQKSDIIRDDYAPMKASCAIPVVCHPYEVYGRKYFDGALSDPVPVQKAFDMGCDKVILLLTKPRNFRRTSEKDEKIAKLIEQEYPLAAEAFRGRAKRYNDEISMAKLQATTGKVLIVAPDDTCGVNTLTLDPEKLHELYSKGYADGHKIREFLDKAEKGGSL